MKNNKGITLIALIITIIVMLILAGISLTFTIGDNGVIGNAEKAKEEKRGAEVAEIIDVWNAAKKVDILGNKGIRTTKTFNEQVDDLVKQGLLSEKEANIVRKHGIIKIGSRLITILDGAPKLQSDMKAIYWDENNNEITSDDKNFDIEDYYSYADKRWANAKTSDGSYWVWIPRYAYCITEGAYSSKAGTIKIEFINKYNELNFPSVENQGIIIESDPNKITYSNASNGKSQEQYLVHPAFTRNADNGGGFGEITGIWVAKFEMSAEESADGVTWKVKLFNSLEDGNVLTTNAGNSKKLVRAVSKDNVYTWRHINIENSYLNSKNYDNSKKSHLIKNSEWGAMAYLSYSEYGTNGIRIKGVESIQNRLLDNKEKTSTANIYGIYGISAGLYDNTASYYSDIIQDERVSKMVQDGGEKSTAYKTVYNGNEEKKGDATKEISDNENNIGWHGNRIDKYSKNLSYFRRGGYATYVNGTSENEETGIFCLSTYALDILIDGSTGCYGFRTCLVVD